MSLRDLCKLLSKSECSLFLGAGASVAGGGLTSDQLKKAIKKKFPYVGDEEDFFKVFDLAIKPDNSERSKVEDYVRSIFSTVRPTQDHRYLYSIPWNSIMTTNFDRLPELIPITLDEKRMVVTRFNKEGEIRYTNLEHLYVLKLFGDMSVHYPARGCMVLNNSDRRRAYLIQEYFFQIFKVLARSGNIVYLGYSFQDELIFELLQEMFVELKGFPHKGFAISPNKPDEMTLSRMKTYHIEWIKGTLAEFVQHSKEFFGDVPKSTSIKIHPINVHGNLIELDRDTFSNIRGKFSIITQNSFITDTIDPRLFFEGRDHSMVPFHYEYDFPRQLHVEACSKDSYKNNYENINDIVAKRKLTSNPADNMKLALIGRAGSGKTVVGKRIAYNWYMNGNPVIFIDTNSNYIDLLAIESMINEIWDKYQASYEEGDIIPPIRYLIICDDGHYLANEIDKMSNILTSQGKPIDILIIDRTSDLSLDELKSRNYNIVYSVDDKINEIERNAFVKHFQSLGFLDDLSTLRSNLENDDINTSFFALIYTSIKEVQKPLRQYILDEYYKRKNENKIIYELVSLIQSFGLKSYRSIISNASKIHYENLLFKINQGKLKDIIYLDNENTYFSTNHRIIADIIKNEAFNTSDILITGLLRIIDSITENIYEEMELVHNLIINRKEVENSLSKEQIEQLFIIASKKVKIRPLFHHLAKNQLRQGKFDDCRMNLKIAFDTVDQRFPEKISNLYDTYGRLELAIAQDIKDETIGWAHLESAEDYFKKAKLESILVNPHPILGLAQTYYEMSKRQTEDVYKHRLCLISLSNLNNLKLNAPHDFRIGQTIALEREIFDLLMELEFNDDFALSVYEVTKNADGYAFLAELCIREDNKSQAWDHVKMGISLDDSSIWLIRLKVELLLELEPNNQSELYNTLLLYLRQSEVFYDIHLSFELAKVQFFKEEWELSKQTFRVLNEKSKGYRYRLIPRSQDRWMENSKPKKIIGTIIDCPVKNRRGEIRSINPVIPNIIRVYSRNIEYDRCKKGDRVSYELVFNMRGPEASRVRIL